MKRSAEEIAPSPRAQRTGAAEPAQRPFNQAGRPTAAELERRKALVMEIATHLFVTQGFAATSLVDIAKGAGVATRTLYQHFGNKEAIFREVIFARDAGHAIIAPELQTGDNLFDALTRAGRYALDITYREKSVGLMRLMIAESTRFPDFMQSVAKSISGRFHRNIEKLLNQCEAAGLLPHGDHKRSAELLADIILGSHPIMTYTNWNARRIDDADLEERVALFIRGRFDDAVVASSRSRKAP